MSNAIDPNQPAASASRNAEKPMSDQSMLWGMSLHFWDVWGVRALIASAILGGVTVLLTFTSAYILYRVADEAQANLLTTSDSHALSLEAQKTKTAKELQAAQEAKLELEKYKRPRNLDADSFSAKLKDVPPMKVQVLYLVDCTDCFWLAKFVTLFLKNAGWAVSDAEALGEQHRTFQPALKGVPPAFSVRAYSWGITVLLAGMSEKPFDLAKPSGALFAALWASFPGGVQMAEDPKLPSDLIRVVVAPKP
jgi:hypothetical protein